MSPTAVAPKRASTVILPLVIDETNPLVPTGADILLKENLMTTFAHAYDRPSNRTSQTRTRPRFRVPLTGVLVTLLAVTLSVTVPALVVKAVEPSPVLAAVQEDVHTFVNFIDTTRTTTPGDPVSGVCDNSLYVTPDCEVTLATPTNTVSVPVPFTPTDGNTLVVISATNLPDASVTASSDDWWVCGYSTALFEGDSTHGPVFIYSNLTGEFTTASGNVFDCYNGTMLN